MGLEGAVVVQELNETDVTIVPRDLAQLPGGFHFAHHGVGPRSQFSQAADDEFLQSRLSEHARHLRIECGHV